MTDDARLKSWEDSSLAAEHIDIDTLMRHASGQLSKPVARVVSEHLAVCEDGRCVEYVRSLGAEVDATSGARYRDAALAGPGYRPRSFQARDAMWADFEASAGQLGISVDELVSRAMLAYARARGYELAVDPVPAHADDDSLDQTNEAPSMPPFDPSAGGEPNASEEELARTVGHLPNLRSGGRPDARSARVSNPPPVPQVRRSATPASPPSGRKLPPPQPPLGRPISRASAAPGGRGPSVSPRVSPSRADSRPSGIPRSPESPRSGAPSSTRAKELVLTYRGQSVHVDKERFLIGRSKTQADLRLDDPNVSRQHAFIERVGSAWYIVDLGSTNGVIVAGERVGRRALSDGDAIVITTHEIQVTLR